MNIQLKGESLKSRGMILYMNRNTKGQQVIFVSETKGKRMKRKNIQSKWNIIKLSQRSQYKMTS